MSDDDLTWQHLSSRYEEAGLMLFALKEKN